MNKENKAETAKTLWSKPILSKPRIRFDDGNVDVTRNVHRSEQEALSTIWYTKQELLGFRSDVRVACANIIEPKSEQAATILDTDSDQDESICTAGLGPYLGYGRCIKRVAVARAIVDTDRRLRGMNDERSETSFYDHSPLLATVSSTLSKAARVRAREEGFTQFCDVYPERAMESTICWNKYVQILQKQRARHRRLSQRLSQRLDLNHQQQPRVRQKDSSGASFIRNTNTHVTEASNEIASCPLPSLESGLRTKRANAEPCHGDDSEVRHAKRPCHVRSC